MQGKPVLSAGRAAKDSAPVVRLRHFHKGIAVSTMERMAYGLGFDVFRMLPVQPFAMGRAKLRPPVPAFRHLYEPMTAQAMEGPPQGLSGCCRLMPDHAVPMGIAPAGIAAVFLRYPLRRKGLAADGTNRRPLHALRTPPAVVPKLKTARQKGRL